MKLVFFSAPWINCLLRLIIVVILVGSLCFHGVYGADRPSKHGDRSPVSSLTNSKKTKECPEKDMKCETDKLGLEAIRSLHLLIDDDHNGDVDQHESDEFLRDELQYTDGFERQALFHNNDKFISVDDLWRAWKLSTVHNWTVNEVIEWLAQDVDLPQYVPAFEENNIDGSVLPRLVNSTSTLLTSLGIRNMHKQRLALKAMDAVLFGAPKRGHSFTKDLLLVSSLILAVGGCWFACLHHRYSQTQVKKMMKDLEALQKAEDALKRLSTELADTEKTEEQLRVLRQNSVRLRVPLMSTSSNGGDKSPKPLSREGSTMRKHEGEKKLKEAEEELNVLKAALSEAETRLELQKQVESQWSVPGELQAWLQYTYELEVRQLSIQKTEAENQRLTARDACDKIKKRNKQFLGSLRNFHSNSLDDIEQTIMDAKAALEKVRQDLQESQHRWQVIEILCGFQIISNPGLAALGQALGKDPADNFTRGPVSLLQAGSIEEVEEDMQSTVPDSVGNIYSEALLGSIPGGIKHFSRPRAFSTGYACNSAGKSSTFLKQQAMAGSTSSLPHAHGSGNTAQTLPRRDSRDADLLLKSASDSPTVPISSTTFHLGPQQDGQVYPGHVRTHSNASLSMMTNGSQLHLRAPYGQSLSHPPFHVSPSMPPGLGAGSSIGNVSTRASGGAPKLCSSKASSYKLVSTPSKISTPTSGRNGVSPGNNITGKINGDPRHQLIRRESSNTVGSVGDGHNSTFDDGIEQTSLDSASHTNHPASHRGKLDRSPELDLNSLDRYSVDNGGGVNGGEISSSVAGSPTEGPPVWPNDRPKKTSKRKKFLPNFLQKGKGKQKSS